MKTTLDIPDALLRQVKARSALNRQSMKGFFIEALRQKIDAGRKMSRQPVGWRAVFGKGARQDIAGLQALLDEEFEKINPDEWK